MAAAPPSGGGPQHYCLRWNNYQSNLTSVFDQLLQNESFVDVTLAVAGRALKAHKVILSASSPYFQTLLHDNPCGHPIIVIEDVAFADMQAVVQFMYKGEINVAEQQLPSLLKVAEALKIRGLADVPDGEKVTRRAAPEPRRPSSGEAARPAGGSPELPEPPTEGWPSRAPPPPPPPATGPTPDRAPPPAPLVTSTELRPTAAPGQAPAPTRAVEETEIRPAIVEMIKEEERAMMMENSNSWSSPPEPTFQHQLQQAWQKSWNQQQSLLQNLRFRERGPLKSWRPETMAAAIMSVLREGHSLSQAARTYDIPYPTFVLYANRVHNLLGPSQEGPGGIPNELRPKGRGRPQRILLGVWPEETVNNVIRAVVFRDTSGLKEQMESKAPAVPAAAAAAGHTLPDMPASLSKLMMQQQQTPQQQPLPNGRPHFRMQAPPMPARAAGPSVPGGGGRGGAQGGLPHPPPAAAARHRPPNLLGFPDMHMMMGMFPPGMLSATGAVPTINLPPLVDQKPAATKTASPPPNLPEVTISSVPVKTSGNDATPALSFMNGPQPGAANGPASAPNGALGRVDSMDADPAAGDSRGSSSGGGPDPSLFEPLQEMTEGDEPFQVRRNLDSPATEASDSPAMPFRAPGEHSSPFTKQMEEVLMSRAAPAGERLSEEAGPLASSGSYAHGEPGASAERPAGPPDVHSSLPPPTAAVLRAMP